MFNFTMNMPFYLMALYASAMIIVVCLLRAVFKTKLPKPVFPVLWCMVLIRLLVPFSLSSPVSAPLPNLPGNEGYDAVNIVTTVKDAQTVYEGGAVSIISENPYFPLSLVQVSAIVICIGALLTAAAFAVQKRNYHIILKDSLLLEQNEEINAIMRDLGIADRLVFTCDNIASPLVCGILRQNIYLPTNLNFENKILLRHILTHEAMHIKRKDNFIKGIMLVTLCLNWYNPLVWLMAKFLSADLEAACDAAVLRCGKDNERQGYAGSLLAMAVSGKRQTLMYSAFSKTEVERRIKSILSYKKPTALIIALSLIIMSGTVVFASAGQAPFNSYLSSFCSSANNKWAVRASLTRALPLNEKSNIIADNTILDILKKDTTKDPKIISEKVQTELSKAFGVEKSAFNVTLSLFFSAEDLESTYKNAGITKNKNGDYLYKGELVRCFIDTMLGSAQTNASGVVDIEVKRNSMGDITLVEEHRSGDIAFDRYTLRLEGGIINDDAISTYAYYRF